MYVIKLKNNEYVGKYWYNFTTQRPSFSFYRVPIDKAHKFYNINKVYSVCKMLNEPYEIEGDRHA